MATSLRRTFVSLDDYFALDRDALQRCEYRNGEVFAMGGAQPEHNTICVNLLTELRSGLRERGCRPFPSDQRVKVNAGSPYLYPDLSVACEPRYLTINGLRTLTNPVLIIEVLSPSTAADDRGAKFLQYQTIETLTDYVLVDSTAMAVLHYRRHGSWWQPLLIEDPGGVLALDTLGISLPLAAIYLDSGVEA
ncbi:Uma2 family endonuclease [uncultured Thiodictyon sp.]|uniref:Uma2 family endonuclease n=1 Tax=uncultured Thiodictyon sp. TaxID=1846217 RepID=UPI0025E5A148|nr:Uma2 family endonuclease [uncultured Thiodictyon sp.]